MPNNLSKANPKVKPVCNECSDEIIVDAWAQWDFEGQQWELQTTFDTAWCYTCDGDTKRWSWKEENQ
jgi:hypothetical protein